MFNEVLNEKPTEMSGGSVHPGRMTHSALGLNYQKTFGTGEISIQEIHLREIVSVSISGEIKKAG